MPLAVTLQLAPHPTTPAAAIEAIAVELAVRPDGALRLGYILAGDLTRLRVPSSRSPERADGLWRQTCFEVFLAAGDGPAYREFNFSPSRQWQAYGFRGYRDGGPLANATAPDIACERAADRLTLTARLAAGDLPGRRLRLGLSAVVAAADGTLSYWALRHAPGQPDFHHPDTFAHLLVLPENTP